MYAGGSYNSNGRGGGGGGGRYGGRQSNHHHNGGPQHQQYGYGQHFPAQAYQQFHPQQQQYVQNQHHQAMAYQQQQQQQQQPGAVSGPPNPYGMFGMQQQQYPQQGYGTPLSPTPSHYQQHHYHQQQQAQHHPNLSESFGQMSVDSSSHAGSTSVTPPSGQIINGTTTYVQPHASSSAGADGAHPVPSTPLSPNSAAAAAAAGPSSIPIPGAYGMPPPPMGLIAPPPPPPHVPPGMMPPTMMAMGMGAAVPMAVPPYGASGMQPNVAGPMSRVGTSGPNSYQQPQHFGGAGGPPQQIYLGAGGAGPASGSTMGPPMGPAAVTAGATGPSALPALPLSARFPPLPPRPVLPPPPPVGDGTDSNVVQDQSVTESQEAKSESEVQLYADRLRQALEAYQARDQAWALRMEAVGFEPARAYVAAVLESSSQSSLSSASKKSTAARDDATPTVDTHLDPLSDASPANADGKDESSTDGIQQEAELRAAVNRRGFAPVLGLRLLQRIHKLETENAELHDLLVDRLQLGGGDKTEKPRKAVKDSSKKDQQAHATKGKENKTKGKKEAGDGASSTVLSEDRAKATVQLLENELQDAHALIAALSNALKIAESK
ncbi:hypothetical protein OC846_002252 [Tilletia horrida]|uniref:Uncharacterized protein n=1 Tax=Tilletia horrida TaxID=155126 RepID=A0AAN6GXC0_9BASI|nr:hypothetical protein OC845_004889 [Tilletia horrida]KAK0554031.1 hypothetical protein OC846_002252 [Tilletia horrida]